MRELDVRLHGNGLPGACPNCAKTLFEDLVNPENSETLIM